MLTVEEQEITNELSLSERESALLDMHSFLNVLNVLIGEYTELEALLEQDEAFRKSKDKIYDAANVVEQPGGARAFCQLLTECLPQLNSEVQQWTVRLFDHPKRQELLRILYNLRSVLQVLEVRLGEYLDRLSIGPIWMRANVEELEADFSRVLEAVQTNSKSRFRISREIGDCGYHDYCVQLRIEGTDGRTIEIPAVAQDILRDLILNARKYSEPGSLIRAEMIGQKDTLHISVEDEGIGIPTEEIETVIGFGNRGSNVGKRRQFGGGFGLTKAYVIARTLGGRFWISSRQNAGTRIRIEIPVPVDRPSQETLDLENRSQKCPISDFWE
jgi:signal transduction histidine kinase